MILPPPFQDPVHLPFYWRGGPHTAVLVHGFPGTPAEMRGVGEALHAQGWSVHGILLPGFGPQLHRLGETKHHEWLIAIRRALVEAHGNAQRTGGALLLAGLSTGAALSLHAARLFPVDGLLLLSPFWRMENRALDVVFALIQPWFPNIRPFRHANFDDATLRKSIINIMPDVDLDDQLVQEALRQVIFPTQSLVNVRLAGRLGYRAAPEIQVPTLVLQGRADDVARPALTRKLVSRLPNLHGYVELPGGHTITNAQGPAWPHIEQLVVQFTHNVINEFTRPSARNFPNV